MRPVTVILLACLALTAAGCGATRTRPPDVSTPARASGKRDVELAGKQIAFTAPGSWTNLDPIDTLVGGIRSGTASLVIWRYPRSEPLPKAGPELRGAQRRLVTQVRKRDPAAKVDSQRTTRVAGAPAIELTTTQTTAGSTRRYRSVHVFDDGAEIVLDGSAPPDQFERVDTTVYQPLLRSLKLRG